MYCQACCPSGVNLPADDAYPAGTEVLEEPADSELRFEQAGKESLLESISKDESPDATKSTKASASPSKSPTSGQPWCDRNWSNSLPTLDSKTQSFISAGSPKAVEKEETKQDPSIQAIDDDFKKKAHLVKQPSYIRKTADLSTPEDYLEKHMEDFNNLLREAETMDGWTFVKEEEGVKAYNKPATPINLFKGDCTLNCTPERLMSILIDTELRKQWDELFLGSDVIAQKWPFYRVVRMQFKAPGPVTNREFIMVLRFFRRDDGTLVLQSISDPALEERYPCSSGFVRGLSLNSGNVIIPLPSGGCRWIYVVHIDPQGWIPGFVKNIVGIKQPLALARCKKHFGL